MENKTKALECLNIPRSSFYYKSIKNIKDIEIKNRVEAVLERHPSYGHRRIAIELKTNKKKIKRVMTKFDIKPRRSRRKPHKSKSIGVFEPSPNFLVSLFPLFQNHIWVTDFTYIKWRGRFVYLATVIDLYTREVVGISIKTNHSVLLATEALLNALSANDPPAFIHSDQGAEYRSKLFRSILGEFKILQSMSKKGSPWQNGYQESFFRNFKVDIGDVNRFKNLGELMAELYRSIYYYNNERIHTSLKMPPKKFARLNEINYNAIQEKELVV